MNELIIVCATYVYVLVAVSALVVTVELKPAQRWHFLGLLVGAGIVASLLAILASHLHYEPRPFVTEHIRPLVAHGTDNGFPSDHAFFTMTLTAAAYFYNRKVASVMLLGTILVGAGRVLAYLHSPQQILAGWLIGIVAVVVSRSLFHYARRTFPKLGKAKP